MPHSNVRDQFDDYDDMPADRQRKSKGGLPMRAIVLLCAVPIGMALLIGGALALRASRVERAEAQAAQVEAQMLVNNGPAMRMQGPAGKNNGGTKRVYSRDEFKARLGSTPDDLTAAVGPPEFRIADGARTTWHYHNTTKDAATGKIDPVTKVVFEGGVVVAVEF